MSHADLTLLNSSDLTNELNNSYDWLILNGFTRGAGILAYPYGYYNDTVVSEALKRYLLARITTGIYQSPIYSNSYYLGRLNAYTIISTTPVASILDAIDNTIIQNSTLILLFHDITDNPTPGATTYLPADFQTVSNYLVSRSNDIDVITFYDMMNINIPQYTPLLNKSVRIYSNGIVSIITQNYANDVAVGTSLIPSSGSIDATITDSSINADYANSALIGLTVNNIDREIDLNNNGTTSLKVDPSTGTSDITVSDWQTSGTYYKNWTESNTDSSANTVHTVGDLKAATYYTVNVGGTRFGTYLSNDSGKITFTYNGGYSTKTFEVMEDTANPSSFTLSSPSNNSSTSSTQPTLSWNASSDSESGLAKYQLYIDGGLNVDNILNTATSVIPANSLSLSIDVHTWFVRAFDYAGNYTDSDIFNIVMSDASPGGSGLSPAPYNSPQPSPKATAGEATPTSYPLVSPVPNEVERSEIEGAPSATPYPQPSSFIFTQTLQFGSNNSQIIQLQDKLKELNFFPQETKSNGIFGPTTKQAVMDYQKSQGIYPNGIVGPRTRKALNNEEFITNKDHQFTEDLKYNDKTEEVKQLQTRLRDQNFFPYNVPSTGWFGPITEKAVNLFQGFYDLVKNGIVDFETRGILNR